MSGDGENDKVINIFVMITRILMILAFNKKVIGHHRSQLLCGWAWLIVEFIS
jgi:hypothetical protein